MFQLVTDQGFLTESSVVWETLSNIEGDGQFVDGEFVTVPPQPAAALSVEDRQNQEDQDYLLALSLQEENKKDAEKYKEWEQFKTESGLDMLTDEELAIKLQAEENERAVSVEGQTQLDVVPSDGGGDEDRPRGHGHQAKKQHTNEASHQQPPPRSPTMPYMQQGHRSPPERERRRSDDHGSRKDGKKQSVSSTCCIS